MLCDCIVNATDRRILRNNILLKVQKVQGFFSGVVQRIILQCTVFSTTSCSLLLCAASLELKGQ